MKKILFGLILSIALLAGSSSETFAYYVRSYYRSNGTYVSGHYKSMPNAYTYDNYSYKSPSYSNGYGYNRSYYYPTRTYSSSWYTPYRSSYNYYRGY